MQLGTPIIKRRHFRSDVLKIVAVNLEHAVIGQIIITLANRIISTATHHYILAAGLMTALGAAPILTHYTVPGGL